MARPTGIALILKENPQMHCWNCFREISSSAKACEYCEALSREALGAEETATVLESCDQLPPAAIAELGHLVRTSATAEEFSNRIMVGNCPECDSPSTSDCENDPEIQDNGAGRCYACGHMFCVDCGRSLDKIKPFCPCWNEV